MLLIVYVFPQIQNILVLDFGKMKVFTSWELASTIDQGFIFSSRVLVVKHLIPHCSFLAKLSIELASYF